MDPTDESAPKPRIGLSTRTWLMLTAVVTEVVVIAAGCNQWVGKRVFDYAGAVPQNGFAHQFVYSTQTYYWRVTKAAGESTGQLVAGFVRIGVVVALSALLIALLVRRGSFWRAAVTSLLVVVFATQVGAIAAGLAWDRPRYTGFTGYYAPIPDGSYVGVSELDGNSPLPGGGQATRALFGEPSGYRFLGGVLLGVVVAVAVGLVARRRSEADAGEFFPQGTLRQQYEQSLAPTLPPPGPIVAPDAYAAPGDMPPPWGGFPPGEQPPPAPGRHSHPDAD